ncbi:Uncharacterised protein [Chlamydia trachomatis]|nr:Uncharacterised protein [Chlamydia trachomatis]
MVFPCIGKQGGVHGVGIESVQCVFGQAGVFELDSRVGQAACSESDLRDSGWATCPGKTAVF